MSNKFSITFTAVLKKSDREGFEIDTNMESSIVGEFTIDQVRQIAGEAAQQFGELLAGHVSTAIDNRFSLD